MFGALALALPVVFHMLGMGPVFLPMFLPILVLGFLVSPRVVATVGVVTPIVSALLTGMPPFFPPIALVMAVELPVMGCVASVLYRKRGWNIYVALAAAIVAPKLLVVPVVVAVSQWLELPPQYTSLAVILYGVPGIVLQAIVVPPAVYMIERRLGWSRPGELAAKRRFFDKAAAEWDETEPTSTGKDDAVEAIMSSLDLRPGAVVVDVGCGTGHSTRRASEQVGASGLVIGADLSRQMLCRAGDKSNGMNIAFVQATADELPLRNECCDAVLCYCAFPHFCRSEVFLNEAHRLLRPGGRLVIGHTAGGEAINRCHRNIGGPVGDDLLPHAGRMIDLLEKASFEQVNVTDEPQLYLAVGLKPCRDNQAVM